jgi:hypothetical protein
MFWVSLSSVGMPLVAIGVVLRLCESSSQKPARSMGSAWFMAIGFLLCLPTIIYLAPAVVDHFRLR